MTTLVQVADIKCSLCEGKSANRFCYECEHYLCSQCENYHKLFPATKLHRVTNAHQIDKQALKDNLLCQAHKQDFIYFCLTCEELICSVCVTAKHDGHRFKGTGDVAKETRTEVKKKVDNLQKHIKEIKRLIDEVKNGQYNKIKNESEHFKTKVEKISTDFTAVIRTISQIHITRANDYYNIENQQLQENVQILQRLSDEQTSLCEQLENVLTIEHDVLFFLNQKSLNSSISTPEQKPKIEEPRIIEHFDKEEFIRACLDEIKLKHDFKIFPKQEGLDDLQEKLEKEKEKIVLIQKKHEDELTKLRDDTLKQVAIERTKFENERLDKAKMVQTEQKNKTRFETQIAKLQETLSRKAAEIVTLEEKIRSYNLSRDTEEEDYNQDQHRSPRKYLELREKMDIYNFEKLIFFCDNTALRKYATHNSTHLVLKVKTQEEYSEFKKVITESLCKCSQLSENVIELHDYTKKKEVEKCIEEKFPDMLCQIRGNIVQLYGSSYDDLQRATHIIDLLIDSKQKTKGRRERKFADQDKFTNKSKEDFTRSKMTSEESLSKSYSPSSGSFKLEQVYSTREGLTVKVYNESILNLSVDCIVNASNENLSHGAGIAAVISRAAGYQFEQECDDYIRRNGSLRVGTCCATSAGNLQYKYVIHTVGPRWMDYTGGKKKRCAADLRQAIVCCFEKAESLTLTSIAFPAISSGIFGVPKEVCVGEYRNAIDQFSKDIKGRSCLKEIHFVDKDMGMISLVQQELNQFFGHKY